MLFVKNSNAIQNPGMASKRRELNWIEVEAHQNLKRIWSEKKQALGLTQESAADELGYKTQGAVSQYLNGRVPLNLTAILGFAKLLKVRPNEISEKLVPVEFLSAGENEVSIEEPTPGRDTNIKEMMLAASPKTYAALEKLQKAYAAGRLTKDDLMLLDAIARRLTNDKNSQNS